MFENNDDYIKYKKYLSDMFNTAKETAKSDCCVVCGKKITTTARSHTLPQFILKEIDEKGCVCRNFFMSEKMNKFFGQDIGIQRASVFRSICDECEHKLFKFYEDKQSITSLAENLNKKMFTKEDEIKLASIYLKSSLKEIYTKSVVEKNMMVKMLDSYIDAGNLDGHNVREANKVNMLDYKLAVDKALDVIFNCGINNFYVYYHKTLSYQVQLVTQAILCVWKDFCGNIVNDVEELKLEIRMDDICVVIFPFDKKTYIVIFGLSEGKERYRAFFKQLKNMKEIDQLKAIQTLIISYSEEVYINPELYKIMNNDEQIKRVFSQGVIPTPELRDGTINLSLSNNDITCYSEAKCYLTNKYAKH